MTREEAINEIKSWAIPSKKGREVLEILIPEFRENEDERIRKELVEKITNLACGCFISQEQKQKFIAYLEKQKEQKPVEWSEEDKRALHDAIITLSMYANGEIPNILPSQMLESAERLRSLCPQPKKDLSKIKSKIILALHHATNCADAQNAIIKTGVEVADVADWLFEQAEK